MKTTTITPGRLIKAAAAASRKAYCPYSRFRVGAAVLTDDNRIFTGCNVENASYGLTVCAERNAVAAAVSAGARHIKSVAVVAGARIPVPPCGACRQVLAEFAAKDAMVYAATSRNLREVAAWPLHELLPAAFDLRTSRKPLQREQAL
jgi:cytidine deaminase